MACAGHVFAAHVRADSGLVWNGADRPGTDRRLPVRPGSTLQLGSGDPIEFRVGRRAATIGQVLHARCKDPLSYLLQAGPLDSPVYSPCDPGSPG